MNEKEHIDESRIAIYLMAFVPVICVILNLLGL